MGNDKALKDKLIEVCNRFNSDDIQFIMEVALADRRRVLEDVDSCVTEEINLSNYDHETICRVSRMWNEALSKIAELKKG